MTMQTTAPILRLQDASLSLNGNTGVVDILHQINLDVAKGETLGLIGPSGSGKSSLLMLMGGLEEFQRNFQIEIKKELLNRTFKVTLKSTFQKGTLNSKIKRNFKMR